MKSEVLESFRSLCLSSDTRSRQCDSITFYKQESDALFGILSLREASERRDLINLPCGLLLLPFKLWLMVAIRRRCPAAIIPRKTVVIFFQQLETRAKSEFQWHPSDFSKVTKNIDPVIRRNYPPQVENKKKYSSNNC